MTALTQAKSDIERLRAAARREAIRLFREIPDNKGIGRRAPSTPLDVVALCKSGALTTRAIDGSSFNHGGVKFRIEPVVYPPVWRKL